MADKIFWIETSEKKTTKKNIWDRLSVLVIVLCRTRKITTFEPKLCSEIWFVRTENKIFNRGKALGFAYWVWSGEFGFRTPRCASTVSLFRWALRFPPDGWITNAELIFSSHDRTERRKKLLLVVNSTERRNKRPTWRHCRAESMLYFGQLSFSTSRRWASCIDRLCWKISSFQQVSDRLCLRGFD